MSKVIVCSDQHLGYVNSKAEDFKNFLGYVANRNDIETLVILGDLVDMWRRDVSGLFLEYSGFIDRFLKIRKAGIKIYIISGNHDYHLLRLQAPSYQFEFRQDLALPSGKEGRTYVCTICEQFTSIRECSSRVRRSHTPKIYQSRVFAFL